MPIPEGDKMKNLSLRSLKICLEKFRTSKLSSLDNSRRLMEFISVPVEERMVCENRRRSVVYGFTTEIVMETVDLISDRLCEEILCNCVRPISKEEYRKLCSPASRRYLRI